MAKAEHGREGGTGRYTWTVDRLCNCGHPLGVHTAARVKGEQPCMNGDPHSPGSDGQDCECTVFRPMPAPKT